MNTSVQEFFVLIVKLKTAREKSVENNFKDLGKSEWLFIVRVQ